MIGSTVRHRMAVWYAALALLLVLLLGLAVLIVERAVLDRSAKASLERDMLAVHAVLADEIQAGSADLDRPDREGLAEAYSVWHAGEPVYASRGWTRLGLPMSAEPGLFHIGAREVRVASGEVSSGAGEWRVAVGRDESEVSEAVGALAMILIAATPVAVAGALGVGWVAAGRALEPTRQLRGQLETITADRLDLRVRVGSGRDEFSRLGMVVNSMLQRLSEAMDAQRRFAADASHQLRTPLTAQRAVGEAALRSSREDAEALADTIGSMLEESERLARLCSGLLELSRTEQARQPLGETDVGELLVRLVERLEPLAESEGHSLSVEAGSLLAVSNAEALGRAVTGLVENALVHCPPPATIVVSARRSGADVVLRVQDDGAGIRPEERERVFDPFVRGSDTSDRPGSGLGLPLARASAWAAGGDLRLLDEPGAVFEIRLRGV